MSILLEDLLNKFYNHLYGREIGAEIVFRTGSITKILKTGIAAKSSSF